MKEPKFTEEEFDLLRVEIRRINCECLSYSRHNGFNSWPINILCLTVDIFVDLVKDVYNKNIYDLFLVPFEDVPLLIGVRDKREDAIFYNEVVKWRLKIRK